MKEIIFLSFGNNSNYIFTHFLNLNDEILKDKTNPLNLNHNSIYNDNYRPRVLLFDYSNNIQKYYSLNETASQKLIDSLKEKHSTENSNCEVYQVDTTKNNFLSMMSEINETNTEVYDNENKENEEEEDEDDEEENYHSGNNNFNNIYFHKNKKNKRKNKGGCNYNNPNEEEEPKKEMSEKLEGLMNLNDNELFEYFNFNKTIKNWNDFLQIKLPSSSLHDIKVIDIDERMITSYIRGKEFLKTGNNNLNYYEDFEDSFRKKLEECDCISCLHLNIDINSYWGGIGLYTFENIGEMINKIPKVLNCYDYNSSFYLPSKKITNDISLDKKNKESETEMIFDVEKFVNYIWFLSDLQDIEGANVLFNMNYLNETKDIIKDIYGYETPNIFGGAGLFDNNENNKMIGTTNLDNIDPTYKYYYSSLSALQLQTFYFPLRSKTYGKTSYINSLNITSNESTINFMESDLVFNLENINNNLPLVTNGTLYNPSRNIKDKNFKWEKLFNKSIYLNNYNSSILIGNDTQYKLMNETIPNYLHKMSNIVFGIKDNYPLSIAFPRKFSKNMNFKGAYEYKNQIPLYINNRPYFDFCLRTLASFKQDHRTYELSSKKYISKIDKDKEFDYRDKCEAIFNMTYVYKDLAEEKLNEFQDDESEDEGPDY